MTLTVRMLAAWLLAVLGSAAVAMILTRPDQASWGIGEGILGIGLIVGLPMLVFAMVIALPLSFYIVTITPIWRSTIAATVAFGAVMAILASAIFPVGWQGASHALILFAVQLGLFWGLTGCAAVRPGD